MKSMKRNEIPTEESFEIGKQINDLMICIHLKRKIASDGIIE
jgi:hypothetical protein